MAEPRSLPRPGRSILERRLDRFLAKPPTVRAAASVIVSATTVVVVASAVLMRLVDRTDFPTIWGALWWALQTATTVGYGDKVPHHTGGYVVGAVVLLEGIAFLAIITAAVTSMFVARAERALGVSNDRHWAELQSRLDRIEDALGVPHEARQSPPSNDAGVIDEIFNPGEPRQRRDS